MNTNRDRAGRIADNGTEAWIHGRSTVRIHVALTFFLWFAYVLNADSVRTARMVQFTDDAVKRRVADGAFLADVIRARISVIDR